MGQERRNRVFGRKSPGLPGFNATTSAAKTHDGDAESDASTCIHFFSIPDSIN